VTDRGQPASPWWSDARSDPWRDPNAPASVVISTPAAAELEPAPDPDAEPRRRIGLVLLISVFSALLAGALGGALGYAFAVRGGVAPGTVLGGSATQAPALAQRPPDSLAGAVQKVLPSVVTIRVVGGTGTSLGSGFLATDDGYIITNDHVLGDGAENASVTFSDGQSNTARVVGRDPESDIAVLKVARAGLTPVEFGDSDTIAVGDPVLALGSPLALSNTVTSGIISALDRPLQEGTGPQVRYYAAIQTDAAINHGNSGGPLVDASGRVIGVNSVIKSLAADDDEAGSIGLAFAIPINQAKRLAQEIIDNGSARRTVIGAQVGGMASDSGARVTSVEANGPAAAAGLRVGDVITKLDGRPVGEPGDLIALVRKYAPGSVVSVEYRRGSARQTASVTLAADVK
jgi:putative serine protease PepD